MTTMMHELGVKQYRQALEDPRRQEIEPGLIMRPFHVALPGEDQEWHVYCERHPEYGFCGVGGVAREAAYRHGHSAH